MDLDKLRDLLVQKIFTDIELIFSNGTDQVTIHAHKNILAISCDYFHKMFHFNKDITTTRIIVDKPDIAGDVVASFYGINNISPNYPEWRHILEVL